MMALTSNTIGPLLRRGLFCLRSHCTWAVVAGALSLLSAASVQASPSPLLSLQNGQLSCLPHDCSIQLGEKASLRYREPVTGPRIIEMVRGDEVLRYYYLSTDLVDIPAYSGKPLEILVGLDTQGILAEVRLIAHKEPILLVGIPEQKLVDLVAFYQGHNITDRIKVGAAEEGYITVDIITGATVTSLVADQTIMTSARRVGAEVGILKNEEVRTAFINDYYEPMSWRQLQQLGAINHLAIQPEDMGLPSAEKPWLDLYYANLSIPAIGRNLLGESTYSWLKGLLKPAESALLVLNNGTWSIKGSGFARGGIFDRFHVEQGMSIISFRDLDYENLYDLEPEDTPDFRESGIFIIRDPAFDPAEPWDLVVLGSRLTGATAVSKEFKSFRRTYNTPDKFVHRQTGMLERLWKENSLVSALYLLLWLSVISIFVFRRRLAKNKQRLEWVHILILGCSLILMGAVIRGQPSVVNLFTLIDVMRHEQSFALFLSDPFLAIGWTLILLTLPFWGRPLFCGWICPYGAFQELLFKIRRTILPGRTKSLEFPAKMRAVLKPLRYLILLTLVAVSLHSLELAERLAEVEPFKTSWIVGVWNRPWPYALWWSLLAAAALLTERFFCRYVCPLGAALSLGSLLHLKPIPRRGYCTACTKCARGCSTFAIDTKGHIDQKECLGCFECMTKMDDKKGCPPLVSPKIWKEYEEGR